MALVASALVRLPILSVLRLAPQNLKTRAYTLKQFDRLAPRARSAAVRQNPRPSGRGQGELYKNVCLPCREAPPFRAGRLQFLRFALPKTLYKMVKNRLLRKPQERFRHLNSGTYL
jgi:hypothetical protein